MASLPAWVTVRRRPAPEREIDGQMYVYESPIRADFAMTWLIKAELAIAGATLPIASQHATLVQLI